MAAKTRDIPEFTPTRLVGVQRVASPVVSYNSSLLTEVHRTGWTGLFGESVDHLSWIVTSAGVERSWGRHEYTADRYAAVLGVVDVALYDERPDSATRGDALCVRLDAELGEGLIIPPGIWHTFRAHSAQAVLLNSKKPPYSSDGVVDKENLPMPNERFAIDWETLANT